MHRHLFKYTPHRFTTRSASRSSRSSFCNHASYPPLFIGVFPTLLYSILPTFVFSACSPIVLFSRICHISYHVIWHHPHNRSIYRSIYRSPPRSINPFYQPVLPLPLVHTGHHTDLHTNHGHPCLVLRYHALITHSQFIWMIRILAPPDLSRNNHSPEHTRNMFIQPTTKESITLTFA